MNTKLSADRNALFERLRKEAFESIFIEEIEYAPMTERNHRFLVWDATRMPTNSHYVPVFLDLVQFHEERGEISPSESILVETSTGNAGAAAAYVARELGYQIFIFMPKDMPAARIADVENYLPKNGVLRLTEEGKYVEGMIRAFRKFLVKYRNGYKGKKLFSLDHSRSPKSVDAFAKVAEHAFALCQAKINVAVFALGNGTSTTGFARTLKSIHKQSKVIGVEPIESPCIYVKKHGKEEFRRHFHRSVQFRPHELIGTGAWGVSFPCFDLSLLDYVEPIRDREWKFAGEELHDLMGRRYGRTSAACFAVVTETSKSRDTETDLTFFSICYDSGRKY